MFLRQVRLLLPSAPQYFFTATTLLYTRFSVAAVSQLFTLQHTLNFCGFPRVLFPAVFHLYSFFAGVLTNVTTDFTNLTILFFHHRITLLIGYYSPSLFLLQNITSNSSSDSLKDSVLLGSTHRAVDNQRGVALCFLTPLVLAISLPVYFPLSTPPPLSL